MNMHIQISQAAIEEICAEAATMHKTLILRKVRQLEDAELVAQVRAAVHHSNIDKVLAYLSTTQLQFADEFSFSLCTPETTRITRPVVFLAKSLGINVLAMKAARLEMVARNIAIVENRPRLTITIVRQGNGVHKA